MPTYVTVAVNAAHASGLYSYHLPPELEGEVQLGQLVRIPFGRQTVQGIVAGFTDQPEFSQTKAVEAVIDPAAVVTPQQIRLAQQMTHDWLAPLAACIGLMLPTGVEQQADQLYTARGQALPGLTPTQEKLLAMLHKRGPLRGQQIDRAMPRTNWRASARGLIKRGLLLQEALLRDPRVRPKMGRTAALALAPEQAEAALDDLGRAGTAARERRQAMLRFLIKESGPVDVAWVYASSGGSLEDLKYLAGRGLVALGEVETLRDPLSAARIRPYAAPPLTPAQQAVWRPVQQALEGSLQGQAQAPLLLHGVTGSGKTEIYLHAVAWTLQHNRQAIVLVPEIALTPQTVQRFAGRFPGRVGIIHSGLSDGERYDTWRRARSGELSLVVGPRSALFTPFEQLGLIVVDESHDDSYYQSDLLPSFHARDVAVSYARLAGAVCLMGSATPDVAAMYHAHPLPAAPGAPPPAADWTYLHLPRRILVQPGEQPAASTPALPPPAANAPSLPGLPAASTRRGAPPTTPDGLPPVEVVDMREELKTGNRSIFSSRLQEALRSTLADGMQAILFLNRRGSATFVFCRDCGLTLKCPRCEIPLTYHENAGELRCHYCGYTRRMPPTCPKCGSARIRHFGTGTQRVEAEVAELLPGVRTLRWDHETTRHKGAHEEILAAFAAHEADVLVGTQMLAKGLDLPLVTLVGVVLADVGLGLPDYRAGERAFQVLTQVAGRAGRSALGGQVVLQSFQPDHYVIRTAARHDYQTFYTQELAYRRQTGYPPFARLVRLEYRHHDPARAQAAAQQLAERLNQWLAEEQRSRTRLIGPAPCFFGQVGGLYRWQIVLCGPDPAGLLRGRQIPEWKIEVNPPSLL
ncbi:MAG: primosomal protein N' [Chloroflexota bacterium]